MARVREFDPDQAIADAMQVFWRCGFADTSMEDIVSETGVSRYGLYGTFGNKKDLLVASLRHYEQAMADVLWTDLRKPDAGKTAIIEYWYALRERAQEESFCAGCLIVNIAAEVAPHEPVVAAEVQRIDSAQAEFFANAIQNGQKAGEIPLDIDAHGTGRMFVGLARGLALMIRAGTAPESLWAAVLAGLRLLDLPESRG